MKLPCVESSGVRHNKCLFAYPSLQIHQVDWCAGRISHRAQWSLKRQRRTRHSELALSTFRTGDHSQTHDMKATQTKHRHFVEDGRDDRCNVGVVDVVGGHAQSSTRRMLCRRLVFPFLVVSFFVFLALRDGHTVSGHLQTLSSGVESRSNLVLRKFATVLEVFHLSTCVLKCIWVCWVACAYVSAGS